ncbi:VWA domain-containing protein [Candidatus Woesearchaeota archaeon]|jgi:Mg-chelatase subunit ChlD|nr:VWA domain-containing protein [Candidatus Woesearchaeota archaeon]
MKHSQNSARAQNQKQEVLPDNKDSHDEEKEQDTIKAKPEKEKSDELQGKLRKDNREDKLLHSKIPLDKDKIDKGKLLMDAINNNISSFSPDTAFENFVNNYHTTKKLTGETMIRELTGYDPKYVDKNINIPEFKRELKERIKKNIEELKKDGLLNKEGFITEQGYDFASLSLLSEELDKLEGKGLLGENKSKEKSLLGSITDYRPYRNSDNYKQLNTRQTIKKAIRRQRTEITRDEFVSSEKESKGNLEIIYVIDNSGSMKGQKIGMAKKAGIALMYKAINNKDEVGLVIFGAKLSKEIRPTNDFYSLLQEMNNIKTSGETDISLGIETATKMFSSKTKTKHIILLTDAVQTLGKKPEQEVLKKVSEAHNQQITISVIGISLNKQGETLAKKIVDISQGSLFKATKIENLDQIILEDYYRARHKRNY